MDDFGVLVESIGFKSQRNSAPLANLKDNTNFKDGISKMSEMNSGFSAKASSLNGPKSYFSSNSNNESFVDHLDGIFRSSSDKKTQEFGSFDSCGDVFGTSFRNSKSPESQSGNSSAFDLDLMFDGSISSKVNSSSPVLHNDCDDIIGGISGSRFSSSGNYDDIFGAAVSPARQSEAVDDFLGIFGGTGSNPSGKAPHRKMENDSEYNDLIPGFGGTSSSSDRSKSETSEFQHPSGHSFKPATSAEDPFTGGFFRDPIEKDVGEGTFFSSGSQSTGVPMSTSITQDPVFDLLFPNKKATKVESASFRASSTTVKASSMTNDDFSVLFGAATSGEFQEIEAESEERQKARLINHKKTQARMAKALAEKNERDFQAQWEQEERHRFADALNGKIKRWAAGKEGNLRALLSSLEHVLWPECGWKPVSLTDLITSMAVKKVYYKATLCVHPDKVQQKGASLEQKYIAEKVFDFLKEAWNKFNLEELR